MSTIKAGKIQPPGDSDPLQIFTNTVERMRVTSGGLVGIGTASPTVALDVAGAVSASGNLKLTGAGSFLSVAYTSDDTYRALLGWNTLQLGNNGQNRIVAGNTIVGGALDFYVNNTTPLLTNATPSNGITAMSISNSGFVNIPGSLLVGGFTAGNVAPNSVLQRGAASAVGRIISLFFIALTPADIATGLYAYYTSTPLDPGLWEIHTSMRENNNDDEDTIYEYHTVTTVPANNFLTYRLTGVAGTVTAVGLQYRFQSSGSSQNAYTSTSPAWSDIGLTNTITASTSSNSDAIIGDGIRNGLVGYPPPSSGTNATTIAYCTGYAKRIG